MNAPCGGCGSCRSCVPEGPRFPHQPEVVEPTPGRARVETWRRGDEQALVHVDERGIVQVSAELLAQVLEQSGWERAS